MIFLYSDTLTLILVEPKHEMYLNFDKSPFTAYNYIVEPKHEMYLNNSTPTSINLVVDVEPKHEMYLNLRPQKPLLDRIPG